jgi:phosphomevalonate kinase
MKRVVCSAPGKVLITGGYLILKRPHSGLVVGASARFECEARDVSNNSESNASNATHVVVTSPQFDTTNGWTVQVQADGSVQVRADASNRSSNAFIVSAVVFALVCATESAIALPAELALSVQGDNDFYSQEAQLAARQLTYSRDSLAALPKFAKCLSPGGLASLQKTGLGSSAALVTSVVGAVLSLVTGAPLADRALLHNCAQLAHCAAQGKVGSGFDVASSVYGTQRYVRFSPVVLADALALTDAAALRFPPRAAVLECVRSSRWDALHEPLRLPDNVCLVLGDVARGSATPGMVNQILAWWDGKLAGHTAADAQALVAKLDAANQRVFSALQRLAAAADATAAAALGDEFAAVRALLKQMGEQAGVPVEPDEQTALLDYTRRVDGVLACGVPGAGGFDAVFVLLRSADDVPALERAWQKWRADGHGAVTMLPTAAAVGGVLIGDDAPKRARLTTEE